LDIGELFAAAAGMFILIAIAGAVIQKRNKTDVFVEADEERIRLLADPMLDISDIKINSIDKLDPW